MKDRRFRTRFLACLLALVLVAGLAGACATEATPSPTPEPTPTTQEPAPPQPTPAPPPEIEPAPAPAQIPESEVIELILASNIPPVAPPAAAVNEWLMQVEELSGGRVHFTPYWAGSLFESKEAHQSFLAGVADCGALWIGDASSVFELNDVTSLPFMGFTSQQQATKIYRQVLAEFPELQAEYEGLHVLYPTMWAEEFGWIQCTNKLITTAADMQGLKCVGLAPQIVKWEEQMGAVPVMVPVEDTYTSLERGLVEAELTGFARIVSGHMTVELYEYHTKTGPPYQMGYNPVIFNQDSWDNLPDDIKKIINDLEPWYTENRQNKEIEGGTGGMAYAQELGHTFGELEPGELDKFLEAAKPIHQEWIDEREAKGMPAKAIYDRIQELIEEVE